MIITGIDPGLRGAVCKLLCGNYAMPQIELLQPCPIITVKNKRQYSLPGMVQLIKGSDVIFIEKAHAMPKQGTASMFKFGFGYGLWQGIASALEIPIHPVAPQTWKKAMLRDMPKGKNSSIIRAKELYPTINLKPTLQSRKDSEGLAEAFLITYYGWTQEK